MQQLISVHMLPDFCDVAKLTGGVAVVIDILRASSTITTALFNGARQVIPCLTIDDALAVRRKATAEVVLLGGERGGVQIEGFELSNSPADYHRAVVENRTIGFTTTNGTKALLHCLNADLILIGAFLNLSTVTKQLCSSHRPVHLVCAGTNGQVTGEDVLFAGAIIHQLTSAPRSDSAEAGRWTLDDPARMALSYWLQTVVVHGGENGDPAVWPADMAALEVRLEQSLRETFGGRNLLQLQYGADIGRCSQIDSAPVLPRFCKIQRNLTAAYDADSGEA